MAVLLSLGHQYPCVSEGEPIDLGTTEAESGEIVEFYLIPDRELTAGEVSEAIWQAAKIKEDYPDCVIHYLKVESNKVTIQFSTAPPGHSPFVWWHVLAIIFGALLAASLFREFFIEPIGYSLGLIPPRGTLTVSAEDSETGRSLNVPFQWDSREGETPATYGDLDLRTYVITWGKIEGYHIPNPQTTMLTLTKAKPDGQAHKIYYPLGVTPPTTGWIMVNTWPVEGEVTIMGADFEYTDKSPFQIEVDIGDYSAVFGEVEGYEAPQAMQFTVGQGDVIPINPEYIKIGWPTWAKVALILGGSAIAVGGGIELVRYLPRIIQRKEVTSHE